MRLPSPTPYIKKIRLPRWAEELYVHMSQTERIVFAWLAIMVLASGIWTLVSFVNNRTKLVAQTGGTYVEAAVGQPRHVNPILAGANDIDVAVARLVYSGLFKLDNNLALQPDLAASYEVSRDNKVYTIHLRRDAHWHDGKNVTADDVVFTIASIQTPDYSSPLYASFQSVTVQKQDDYTVIFRLSEPYSPFLSTLTVGIVPKHIWQNIAPKNANLSQEMLKPIGSGPFKFDASKSLRKTGEITEFNLVRNNSYYGQRPFLDKISFAFYGSHEQATRALETGKVDGIGFLPLQLLQQVQRHSSLAIHQLSLPQYFALFFNEQKSPVLADAGVRNALALALDRDAIVKDALHGQGEPLYLPIPPGTFGYNSAIGAPQYDPERAKQNLEDAGWKVQGDGIRKKGDRRLEFTITTTDWPEYMRTAELLREQWKKIGVAVNIDNQGAGTIQQTVISPRNYQALFFGEILSSISDPYPFWHSSQVASPGLNFSMFKNKDVDAQLKAARESSDLNVRRENFEKFQGIILDLKPALVLYRPYYLFVTGNNMHGVTVTNAAVPADRFNNISQWYVKVKRVWK